MGIEKATIVGFGNTGYSMAKAMTAKAQEYGIREIHVYNRDSEQSPSGLTKSQARVCELRGLRGERNPVTIIRHESYETLPNNGIHIIAAKEGYSYKNISKKFIREQTVPYDAKLIRKIAQAYAKKDFNGQVFMVSNPVGPFSNLFQEYSNIDPEKIMQFGAVLDRNRWIDNLNLAAHISTNQELGQRYNSGENWFRLMEEAEKLERNKIENVLVVGDHSRTGNIFLNNLVRINEKPLTDHDSRIISDAKEKTLIEGPLVAGTLGYSADAAAGALLDMLTFYLADNHPVMSWGYLHNQAHIVVPTEKKNRQFVPRLDLLSSAELSKLDEVAKSIIESYEGKEGITGVKEYAATDSQHRRILIIEDEDQAAKDLQKIITRCAKKNSEFSEKNELQIDIAKGRKEMLSLVERNLYDLALTDEVLLGGELGHKILEEAHKIQPMMKAIMLSAQTNIEQAADMMGAPYIAGFIIKPFLQADENYADSKSFEYLMGRVFRPTQKLVK